VLDHPTVIQRHMVRNEIERQAHASFRKFLPGNFQTTGPS
jgi:hypothetical protein